MPVVKTRAKRKPFKSFIAVNGNRIQLGVFTDSYAATLAVAIAHSLLFPEQMLVPKYNNPDLEAVVKLRVNAYLDKQPSEALQQPST